MLPCSVEERVNAVKTGSRRNVALILSAMLIATLRDADRTPVEIPSVDPTQRCSTRRLLQVVRYANSISMEKPGHPTCSLFWKMKERWNYSLSEELMSLLRQINNS